MSCYKFSLKDDYRGARWVIAEIPDVGDQPVLPRIVVHELKDISLTVALEGSGDGTNWTRLQEWNMTAIGWNSFPPRVLRGPRIRVVAWTLGGKAAAGYFELPEVRGKSAS